MKQFFILCVFAFASASAFVIPSLTLDPLQQIKRIAPEIFNLTGLKVDLDDIKSSISPGKCPEATELPEPFKLNSFLGTWYEIKRTGQIFESGLRCVQANYKLDQAAGNVIVNNSGVNPKGKPVATIGTATTTDKSNVFAVKFFPLSPSAQYWVVDTDYTGYSLVVSCNNVFGFFNINDAWILSRKPSLENEIIQKLEAKVIELGFTKLRFTDTPQDC